MQSVRRPLNILRRTINNNVIIKLKDGSEYKGQMTRCDTYMNIILEGATEYYKNMPIAKYGNIFIRGNNVLYICLDSSRLA